MRLYVVVFLIILSNLVCGQSLNEQLKEAKQSGNSKLVVDTYNALSTHFSNYHVTKSLLYADSAFKEASISNYIAGAEMSLISKMNAYLLIGEYNKVDSLVHYSEKSAVKLPVNKHILIELRTLRNMGFDHLMIEKIDSIANNQNIPDKEILPFLILKTKALIDLGNIQESQVILDSLQSRFGLLESIEFEKIQIKRITGEYDAALYDSKKIVKNLDDEKSFKAADMLIQLGDIYSKKGIYDSALFTLNHALEIFNNGKNEYGAARTKQWLGTLNYLKGDNSAAVQYYYEALQTFQLLGNKRDLILILADLAWIYSESSDLNAYHLIKDAINYSIEINNQSLEAVCYNYLGSFYEKDDKLDSAIIAYDKCIEIRKSFGDIRGLAIVEFNKGVAYESMGLYQKALQLYLKTYPFDLESGEVLNAAISEYSIGGVYTKLKNYNKAIEYLSKSREKLESLDAKVYLMDCLIRLANYYNAIGDLSKELATYKEYMALKDEVHTSELDDRLAEVKVYSKLEMNKQQLALLNLENENKRQSLELQRKTILNQRAYIGLISFGVFALIVISLVIYRLYKIKSKSNKSLEALYREISEKTEELTAQSEELREANEEILSLNEGLEKRVEIRTQELKEAHKELDTFFYHASHDFRRPLTTFLGLSEIAHTIIKDKTALELFDKVRDTAWSLDRMVSKLKAISTIDFDELRYTIFDLSNLINKVLNHHKDILKERGVKVIIKLQSNEIHTSFSLLEIIIDNLIENAILYSNPKLDSYVQIESRNEGNDTVIKVSDNGQGIEKELIPRIFEMYFRANETSQGNGLGLYISKKAINKLNGIISFETELEKGSTFEINLPNSKI